ncbi:hypothetical protein STEG23_006653 [Scotinomys teguina]
MNLDVAQASSLQRSVLRLSICKPRLASALTLPFFISVLNLIVPRNPYLASSVAQTALLTTNDSYAHSQCTEGHPTEKGLSERKDFRNLGSSNNPEKLVARNLILDISILQIHSHALLIKPIAIHKQFRHQCLEIWVYFYAKGLLDDPVEDFVNFISYEFRRSNTFKGLYWVLLSLSDGSKTVIKQTKAKDSKYREKEKKPSSKDQRLKCFSVKKRVPPLGDLETLQKRGGKIVGVSRNRGHKENMANRITKAGLIWTWRLMQQAWVLHESAQGCYVLTLLVRVPSPCVATPIRGKSFILSGNTLTDAQSNVF